MGDLVNAVRSLGTTRLIIMGAVIAAMGGFFMYLTTQVSKPEMSLLYADLEVSDASKIINQLENMGVPVQARGDGTQVFVPSEQVGRLRMAMAEQGLPAGGSIGYEIFDKSDALGATGFSQEINHVRALEGELARTIRSIRSIAAARIHLVMPRRELFSREKMDPSASIVLKMKGAMRLNDEQVASIQHLVAAAVPALIPARISIIDDKGTLLARGSEASDIEKSGTPDNSDNESLRLGYESRLARSLETLLEKTLGLGKVRAEVAAEMDFERITENSEVFDPNGQVVRSTQTSEDGSSSADHQKAQQASTVQNNVPPANTNNAGKDSSDTTTNSSKRNEEVVNYEISKTIKTHIKENGGIKRLSVAVLVDGNNVKDAKGKETYTALTKEQIEQITKLVKSAIGFKSDRGDSVEVINMKFATAPDLPETAGAIDTIMGFERPHIVRLIEILIVAVVGFLSVLIVVKPLFNRLLDRSQSTNENNSYAGSITTQMADGEMQSLPGTLGGNQSTAGTQSANSLIVPGGLEVENSLAVAEQMMQLQNVEGKMRASSIQQIANLVDNHPEETVSVMRNWIYNK